MLRYITIISSVFAEKIQFEAITAFTLQQLMVLIFCLFVFQNRERNTH